MCFFIGCLGILLMPDMFYLINHGNFHQNQWLYLVLFVAFDIFLLFQVRRYKLANLSWLGVREWGLVVGLLFLTISLLMLYQSLTPQHQSDSSQGIGEILRYGLTYSFVMDVALLNPIMEEIFMRGLLQGGAFENRWWGLLMTAGIFSIGHGPSNLFSFGFYALMGMFFGIGYKLTNKMWVPIFLHIGWNSFAVLPLFFVS
ncbi:Membrane-bound protease, CAAX family [Streptococcus sp. DD10]|nr:Membrane-bound protease, CAAX family [Streptococcus sp. DD10]